LVVRQENRLQARPTKPREINKSHLSGVGQFSVKEDVATAAFSRFLDDCVERLRTVATTFFKLAHYPSSSTVDGIGKTPVKSIPTDLALVRRISFAISPVDRSVLRRPFIYGVIHRRWLLWPSWNT
jgi:hypothetical protein